MTPPSPLSKSRRLPGVRWLGTVLDGAGWLAFFAAASLAPATQVDWNGMPFSTNLTSTGQPWDDTWVAELGSFTGSFTPTSANTASWAAAWRAASRSVYLPGTGYFGGSCSYEANAAPFLTGVRAYLWLFNPSAPQGEWILLTNPVWTWPAGSAFDPFTTTWASADASQAVVGQLPAPGWALKSAAVLNSPLPALTWTDWRSLYFTPSERSNASLSGPAADADGDGTSNLAEYGAGSHPRRASSFPPAVEAFLHQESGQTYGAARLRRSTRVTGYTWQVQAGDDLSGGLAGTVTVNQQPWEWTVRRQDHVTAAPRGFLRFSLVP